MIDIKIKNLELKKVKIGWENGQEMANECVMALLQILCNADKAIEEHMPVFQEREELRCTLSDVLINIVNDFQDDTMHKYYERTTESNGK